LYLIDTSAWARIRDRRVARSIAEAIEANAVVMVAPIALELLRSARSATELDELAGEYDALREVALTPDMSRRAREVQRELSFRGYHRGPSPIDLLAAAAAEAVGAEIWHCDRHFELIAEVTGQPERRVGRPA
jgi:predicted nucleic acid-binding protein